MQNGLITDLWPVYNNTVDMAMLGHVLSNPSKYYNYCGEPSH